MSSTPRSDAWAPLPAGPLLRLAKGRLSVAVAPQAGGRIAQIRIDGVDQLIGPDDVSATAINWGSYPMLPWAGRIRDGRFRHQERDWQLPLNLPPHAIHGVGFVLPWQVDTQDAPSATLSLALPTDASWPFGGMARQRIQIEDDALALELSVQAGARSMPAVIGWHPWFRKPEQLWFTAKRMYPRDADGIATLPLTASSPGPWDDCFVEVGEIALLREGKRLRLTSDCSHWVVYDQTDHATCVEPQTGPPDAFNLAPQVLSPGQTLSAHFRMAWTDASA